MSITYPNGVTVTNIMADGSECDDLSTYIKSVDQLPDQTKRMLVYFMEQGTKVLLQEREGG